MTKPVDPTTLLFPDGALDPDEALALTLAAIGAAEDGELYLAHHESETLGFDDGRLTTADRSTDAGFGLRAVSGEQTGFAHANRIDAAAIRRAGESLRLIEPRRDDPAPPPRATNARLYDDASPLDAPGFAEKVALCQQIDAAARARDPRVVQVSVSLSTSWSVVGIVRADGTRTQDVRPLVRLNINIVAEANGRRESGSFGIGGRRQADDLLDPATWQRGIDTALAQALHNLDAKPAPAGTTTVLLGPGWPGILLHEAVGHGLEGDFNRKGTSAFAGRLGTRVAASGVSVIDDGSLLSPVAGARRGSLSIDDEGTPTGETVLIEDGILVGYMQDRQNARLMGMAPTGNGRRESFAHAPMPRMTNTYMRGGEDDPAELLSRVKDGIYCTSFGGGQVDIVSGRFTFSCTQAWKVENGRLVHPIRGATLTGDGPEVLTRVIGIGNDLAFDEGIGMCGKGGQGVPAGVGQPTLLIDAMTVGGTAA